MSLLFVCLETLSMNDDVVSQVKSLEDYYQKQRKLLDFKVAGAPSDTWQQLLAILHLQQMSTLDSTKKLTA